MSVVENCGALSNLAKQAQSNDSFSHTQKTFLSVIEESDNKKQASEEEVCGSSSDSEVSLSKLSEGNLASPISSRRSSLISEISISSKKNLNSILSFEDKINIHRFESFC